MSAQPETQKKVDHSRRDFLRKVGVGSATAAGVSTGAIRLDHGPVQNSQAIAPAVVAGGVGGSMAVGWALREFEILGSDTAPEGMTPESLQQTVEDTFRARRSNNKSTFIDNKNIIEGISHSAWADGKIAGIDALNEQVSQSDVLQAAQEAVQENETTIKKNFLKSWNETAREFITNLNIIKDHPDLNVRDVIDMDTVNGFEGWNDDTPKLDTVTHELPTEDFEIDRASLDWDYSGTDFSTFSNSKTFGPVDRSDSQELNTGDLILDSGDWSDIYQAIDDAFQEVYQGLDVWVDNVYDEVQAGTLDTGELLTPREQAELTSEDEDFPQAISDLQALNVSVDLEREAEIYISDVGATLYGQLAYTGDTSLEVGTIDPDATDDDGEPLYPGTIFFTYDISQGQGQWDAYDEGLDGGTLTITSEPFDETVYLVDTAAGETAEFTADDLAHDEDNTEWTVDLSDQLDDQITQVEQIEYYSEVETTQFETIRLEDSFEIITFTDSDGNEYEETDFQRSEPQTDDNYITQEEWEEQQERHEELIEKYEDAQGGGGITIGGTSIPNELIGLGLAVAAAIGLLR